VDIVWDETKNEFLKRTRGVCFEDVAKIIRDNNEIDMIVNHTKVDQDYYVVKLNEYIHLVPCLIKNEQIVLKTIFPSRKYNKIYGGLEK
jgi:uncharacterized DUF497 family protein